MRDHVAACHLYQLYTLNLFVQNADSTSQRINHYPVLEVVLWVQYVVAIVQAIELSSG